MKKTFLLPAFMAFTLPFAAQGDTFDTGAGILTIPSVTVGANTYVNVSVRLDRYAVLAATGPASGVSVPCDGSANLAEAKISAIGPGMGFDQVRQLLGCDYNPALTVTSGGLVRFMWATPALDVWVKVFFGATALTVPTASDVAKSGSPYPVCDSRHICI